MTDVLDTPPAPSEGEAGPSEGGNGLVDAPLSPFDYAVDDEGAVDLIDAHVLGTSLHGLFENDGFRSVFLGEVARRAGKVFIPAGVSFPAAREAQIDRMADLLEAHLDLDAVFALIRA